MRVLLCQSYLGPTKSAPPIIFPLGLSYLASMIKNGHEVHCWDSNVSGDYKKDLAKLLEKTNPEIVGVSLRNIDSSSSFNIHWYYPFFVSMIRLIKEIMPSCRLVVGGCGFSLFAEEIMKNNHEIDFGIISEGEYPFANLLKNLMHPEKVSNLLFRMGGRIHATEKRVFDFDTLPQPALELFDLRPYQRHRYSMSVQSKRGCGFNCIFCPSKFLFGNRYRLRSPKMVVDEIKHLQDCMNLNSYFFVDSTFNHPYDYSRKILQEITKEKLAINWTAEFTPLYMNKSFVRDAIRSGCKFFFFSPDGASNEALSFLRKGFRLEHIEKTITLAQNEKEMNVGYNFMYDLPYHNSENNKRLSKLVLNMILKLREKLYFITLTKMRIYPKTRLYEIAVNRGKIGQDSDVLYPTYYSDTNRFAKENFNPVFLQKLCAFYDIITKKCRTYDF